MGLSIRGKHTVSSIVHSMYTAVERQRKSLGASQPIVLHYVALTSEGGKRKHFSNRLTREEMLCAQANMQKVAFTGAIDIMRTTNNGKLLSNRLEIEAIRCTRTNTRDKLPKARPIARSIGSVVTVKCTSSIGCQLPSSAVPMHHPRNQSPLHNHLLVELLTRK